MNRQYLASVHYSYNISTKSRELLNFIYSLGKIGVLVGILLGPAYIAGKKQEYFLAIFIGVVIAIIASLYNIYLAKMKGIMLAVDAHQLGIWASSPRHHRMLYIPFKKISSLKIVDQRLVLQYQQSFIINEQRGPKITGSGQLRYPLWIFSTKEFDKFLNLYNQLVPKRKRLTISLWELNGSDRYAGAKVGLFALITVAFLISCMPSTSNILHNFNESDTEKVNSHIRLKNFQLNKTYESSDYRFKFLKAYRTTTTYDNSVGVVRVEATAKRSSDFDNLPDISGDSFASARTSKDFYKDEGETNDLVSYVILKNGRGVVNQLNGTDNVQKKQRVTFNIVFEIPNSKKDCYLAYKPFELNEKPYSSDDSTAIIWKVKPADLEELK